MLRVICCFTIILLVPHLLLAADKATFDGSFELIDPRQPASPFVTTTDKLKKPQRIRADFTQAKYLKVLKKPFLSSGRLLYVREHGVYWEIKQPLTQAYLISSDGMQPLLGQHGSQMLGSSPISAGISRIFASIIGGDIEVLGDTFSIYYAASEAGWAIKLQPKDTLIAKVLASIDLSGQQYIDHIRIIENSGDYTELSFTEIKSNKIMLTPAEMDYFSD